MWSWEPSPGSLAPVCVFITGPGHSVSGPVAAFVFVTTLETADIDLAMQCSLDGDEGPVGKPVPWCGQYSRHVCRPSSERQSTLRWGLCTLSPLPALLPVFSTSGTGIYAVSWTPAPTPTSPLIPAFPHTTPAISPPARIWRFGQRLLPPGPLLSPLPPPSSLALHGHCGPSTVHFSSGSY